MEAIEPSPRPFGVSTQEAIELCREWMIYLGATDTVVSAGQAKDLCDLYSARYLGWVFNDRGNLDVGPVEAAATLAGSDGRSPLIFIQGGVRPIAQQRADMLGVALLNYHARDGSLAGRSKLGRATLQLGLRSY